MAANEFEKQVQRAMDEFKLHPSDDVWQKVEQNIREKKRKRRIIFFVLFLLVGLTLGGYGIYHFSVRENKNSQFGQINTQQRQGTRDKTQGTSDKVQGTGDKTQGTRDKAQGTSDKVQGTGDKEQQIGNAKNIQSKTLTKPRISHGELSLRRRQMPEKKSSYTELNRKKDSEIPAQKNKIISSEQQDLTIKIPVQGKKEQQKDDEPKEKPGIAAEDVHQNKNDTILSDSAAQKTKSQPGDKDVTGPGDTSLRKTDQAEKIQGTAQVKKIRKQDQRFGKLKWGINFSVGSSTLTQDAFSFKGTVYSGTNASSAPSTSTGGGSGLIYGPSSNKPALAFKAGVDIRKDISLRSNISLGLLYSYMGDKIKVGTNQSSSQQSTSSLRSATYYSATTQNRYSDHFHFLELPVIYEWRMNKNSHQYFSLNGGVSAAYLISTNALVYDTALSGIYYHDKSLFARSHVKVLSGVSYHFRGGKNVEINLGPQFSFDMTRLIRSDLDKRKYFLYGGIDARLFFDGRKK